MDDRRAQLDRLCVLAEHLAAHMFVTEVTLTMSLQEPGGEREEFVTCRPRPEDEGRLWFFDGVGRPLAEAGRITDAVVAVKGRLIGGRA